MMRFIYQTTVGVTGRDDGKDNSCITKIRESVIPRPYIEHFQSDFNCDTKVIQVVLLP